MHRDTTFGLRLITTGLCLLLLVLQVVVCAGTPDNTTPQATISIVPSVTSQPATTISPVESATIAVTPPPVLILDTPVIENLTCTIFGSVDPGSVNATIVSVRWDWGDNQTPEYHGFPNSHVYSSPGTYTVSITALQSDGQTSTWTTDISVVRPVITETFPVPQNTTVPGGPGGPGTIAGAPLLTLLEPVIDGMNVTLNGNLNPGSPGVTIDSVNIDWNDGNITSSPDLPVHHQYSGPGTFTVTITGNQSDGQSTTRRIALDLRDVVSVPPTQAPSGPPPPDLIPYFISFAVIIIVVVIAAAVLITRRSWGPPPVHDIPSSPRNGRVSEYLPSPEELAAICSGTDVAPAVLDSVLHVSVEIAREGREGKMIGTSFVVGDSENVKGHSKQFVLNPFYGHQEAERQITNAGTRGAIKEFAQLDGAFLVSGSGLVEAAGRCITVDMSRVDLPGGLGSRHSSAAGITQATRSIGVVVSQSGGLISIFKEGKIVYTLNS
jgi:DNA integrity scanning protein DisA with diadenylate cyclase activity/PKD repeat protein